jgi:hypothetical protein
MAEYNRLDNPLLDSLELSVRADRVLRAWGRVQSMDDFVNLKRSEVMALKGAGVKTWNEIVHMQRVFLREEAKVAPVQAPPSREAAVIAARGMGELRDHILTLARDGFRIVAVIDTQNGDYHVVAQKEM